MVSRFFHCYAEIMRAGFISNQGFVGHENFGHERPFRSPGQQLNGRPMDAEGWSAMPTKVMLMFLFRVFWGNTLLFHMDITKLWTYPSVFWKLVHAPSHFMLSVFPFVAVLKLLSI